MLKSQPITEETYGVGPVSWGLLQDCLQSNPAVESIILFGSRAKGTARIGSDIDLAIKGTFSADNWLKLLRDVDDIEILYKVDLVDLGNPTLHSDLVDHISRVGITIFSRS
jgi:predicted nucleotidyltransferase